jgi:hypothetical protein
MRANNTIISADELRQSIVELATPIDFDQLIEDGILEKDGAWYKIRDPKSLPKHASMKIKSIQTGPKGTRVKFRPVTKSTLNLLRRIQG